MSYDMLWHSVHMHYFWKHIEAWLAIILALVNCGFCSSNCWSPVSTQNHDLSCSDLLSNGFLKILYHTTVILSDQIHWKCLKHFYAANECITPKLKYNHSSLSKWTLLCMLFKSTISKSGSALPVNKARNANLFHIFQHNYALFYFHGKASWTNTHKMFFLSLIR